MEILVSRYNSAKDHTNSVMIIDGNFECYGLEDEFRNFKVYGETRIPDGRYPVKFRKVGGFHNRYLKRFGPQWHKGMLEITKVPNFKFVLVHIGNDDEDTDACYVVGDTQARGENFIGSSTIAYKRMYPKVRNALLRGEEVWIEYKTLDNPHN
ncbi:DUF5675 family protein [Winogradskyella sp.]|uniref:DUF5675 family protein n=1 Tax=Winogradskyella sp. TaxID=1883156 RepID=UPI003BAA3870